MNYVGVVRAQRTPARARTREHVCEFARSGCAHEGRRERSANRPSIMFRG